MLVPTGLPVRPEATLVKPVAEPVERQASAVPWAELTARLREQACARIALSQHGWRRSSALLSQSCPALSRPCRQQRITPDSRTCQFSE